VPIIGVGLYPKVLTQIYDSKTLQITDRVRESVTMLVQHPSPTQPLRMQVAPHISEGAIARAPAIRSH
jgi:NAD(P)H-quinone oxidoreductase subunit 4